MENIEELWERLQLRKDGDFAIDIGDDKVEVVQKKRDRCLIENVWVDRYIGKVIIEVTTTKIWRLSERVLSERQELMFSFSLSQYTHISLEWRVAIFGTLIITCWRWNPMMEKHS